jgi:hypothetical protein
MIKTDRKGHNTRNRISTCYDNEEQRMAECDRIWPGDPTPEEILERAALIRLEWSEAEHRRRAGITSRAKRFVPRTIIIPRFHFVNYGE